MNPTANRPPSPDQPLGYTQPDAALARPQPVGGDLMAWQEMRLGLAVAQRLAQASAAPHPDVETRLRFARERALLRAREVARAATTVAPARNAAVQRGHAWGPTSVAGAGTRSGTDGARAGGGPGHPQPSWRLRLLALIPWLVLVAGLQWVQEANQRERVLALAELDAELLINELHPVLYSDPGFTEFLRDQSR